MSKELDRNLFFIYFYFFWSSFPFIYLFILLYNVVLVLPYINMHPPQVYTCSLFLTPAPSSLPIPSLWVIPVHQPQASCILHRNLFFKKRHTNSQQLHEKMSNMTNHQGSQHVNHKEILSYIIQSCYYRKDEINDVAEDVWKSEPLCTIDEDVNCHSHYVKQYEVPEKIKHTTTI